MKPTTGELINALEAAAGAKPYYDLVDRERVGGQTSVPRAIVPARTSRQTQDYIDIQEALGQRLDRGGKWAVVRRGRPGARIRVIYAGAKETAERNFEREHARMRQGMLALVHPMGFIDRYASEPMVRSRW